MKILNIQMMIGEFSDERECEGDVICCCTNI